MGDHAELKIPVDDLRRQTGRARPPHLHFYLRITLAEADEEGHQVERSRFIGADDEPPRGNVAQFGVGIPKLPLEDLEAPAKAHHQAPRSEEHTSELQSLR